MEARCNADSRRAGRTHPVRSLSLAAALALGGFAAGAQAANDDAALRTQVRSLAERMEQLERRNRELEKQVIELKGDDVTAARAPDQPSAATPASAAGATLEQRLKTLENAQAQTERSLASERLSETEPELVTRLKALEYQTLSMQKQARQIEALEGISVGASLVGMAQRVDRKGSATGNAESRLTYRGDVSIALPGGSLGDADGAIFAQIRFG